MDPEQRESEREKIYTNQLFTAHFHNIILPKYYTVCKHSYHGSSNILCSGINMATAVVVIIVALPIMLLDKASLVLYRQDLGPDQASLVPYRENLYLGPDQASLVQYCTERTCTWAQTRPC